jgi:hypothetical protein
MPDLVVYVYRDGVQIGRASFTLGEKDRVHGSHVYSALGVASANGAREWLATTSIGGGPAPGIKSLAAVTKIPAEFVANVRAIIEPATSLILTDLPVSPETHSEKGFGILTTAADK